MLYFQNPHFLYDADGVYNVKLTVTDSGGDTHDATEAITIPVPTDFVGMVSNTDQIAVSDILLFKNPNFGKNFL